LHRFATLDTIWKVFAENVNEVAITSLPETFLSEFILVHRLWYDARVLLRLCGSLLLSRAYFDSADSSKFDELYLQIVSIVLSPERSRSKQSCKQEIPSFHKKFRKEIDVERVGQSITLAIENFSESKELPVNAENSKDIASAIKQILIGSQNNDLISLVSKRLYMDIKTLMSEPNTPLQSLQISKFRLGKTLFKLTQDFAQNVVNFAERDFMLHSYDYLKICT